MRVGDWWGWEWETGASGRLVGVGDWWEWETGGSGRLDAGGVREETIRGRWYGGECDWTLLFCSAMSIINDDAFRAWEVTAPNSLQNDPVWRFHAYRVALFMLDLAAMDARELQREQPRSALADQLLRSVASVSANISEGLGRPTTVDRTRFISIALGSLRESLSWYRAARVVLPEDVCNTRDDQLSELRRLLLGYQRWLASRPDRQRLL